MTKPQWKKNAISIILGSTLLNASLAEARELVDETYTTWVNQINSGNHTVNNGDVTLDASGYTGSVSGQKPIISTLNGAVNIDISEGNTLTIKGFNRNTADHNSVLYAYQRGTYPGSTITFTGGNVVVSNHATNVNTFSSYAIYGGAGGKFDFKSDGDNKINLTVYIPVSGKSSNRTGIYLNDSAFNFDGKNLTVNLDGNPTPSPYNTESRFGINAYNSVFTFNGEDFTVNMDSNLGNDGNRIGLNINNSTFDLNGKNFTVKIDGNSTTGKLDNQVGLKVYGGSNVDIHAEHISIESDGYAVRMGNYASYDPINTAKFEADTLIFKGRAGILAGNHAYALGIYDGIRNTLEFTGHTLIEAIAQGGEDDTYRLNYNGRALSLLGTDVTFNSDRGVTVYGENLTPQGLIPEIVGDLGALEVEPYNHRTVSLLKDTNFKANTDFSITSNGGYYNTALHILESQAQFNGKTRITVQNGIDTARGIYIYDGDYGRPTKAEFNDDLSISLADTQANYIAGIEALDGGKVEVKKGLFINDNSEIYWSLYAGGVDINGAAGQIDVNTTGTGTVQVVGDIGAKFDGVINMTLNNEYSYLTASSYTWDNSGTVNMDISNQAVWNMTGNSSVNQLSLAGQGRVNILSPDNNGSFKTLRVHDDFIGGGALTINTALGDDNSETDKLVVEGNTSGTTDLYVNNYNGSGAQTIDGIEIITVAGQSDGVFELGNRVVAGAYEYHIEKVGNNWHLNNTLPLEPTPRPNPDPTPNPQPEPDDEPIRVVRPEAGAYIANLAAANTLFTTRLHDRLGETQYTDLLTGETKVTSMWLRQEGGHNRSRVKSGQSKTQANRYVVQIGGDIAQWSNNKLDRYHVGVMAGYGHVNGNSNAKYTNYQAKNKVNGYALGLYGTWYANQEDKSGLYVDSWIQYAWFDNTVQGDGLSEEKYDSKGWLASIESGYSFKLGENERSSYWLQPKAQVTWMGVHADKHRETNGTLITGKSDNLSTRLGVRFYVQGHNEIDDHTGRVFQPFVEANWLYNSQSFGVTMNNTSDYQAGTRNIGEVKVGVEAHLNKNLNMWGNVAQQMGDKGYSDTQATVGVKYSF